MSLPPAGIQDRAWLGIAYFRDDIIGNACADRCARVIVFVCIRPKIPLRHHYTLGWKVDSIVAHDLSGVVPLCSDDWADCVSVRASVPFWARTRTVAGRTTTSPS